MFYKSSVYCENFSIKTNFSIYIVCEWGYVGRHIRTFTPWQNIPLPTFPLWSSCWTIIMRIENILVGALNSEWKELYQQTEVRRYLGYHEEIIKLFINHRGKFEKNGTFPAEVDDSLDRKLCLHFLRMSDEWSKIFEPNFVLDNTMQRTCPFLQWSILVGGLMISRQTGHSNWRLTEVKLSRT